MNSIYVQLGFLALTLIAPPIITRLIRRRAQAAPLSSQAGSSPVILKYDARQTAIGIPAFLFVGYGMAYMAYDVLTAPRHIDGAPLMASGLALAALVAMTGAGLFLYKLISPDQLSIDERGIELYSFGRTRYWSWTQITDVQLKSRRDSKGRRYDAVCLDIPTEDRGAVDLPHFLRSDAGPEDEQAVYALVRKLFLGARNRSGAFSSV